MIKYVCCTSKLVVKVIQMIHISSVNPISYLSFFPDGSCIVRIFFLVLSYANWFFFSILFMNNVTGLYLEHIGRSVPRCSCSSRTRPSAPIHLRRTRIFLAHAFPDRPPPLPSAPESWASSTLSTGWWCAATRSMWLSLSPAPLRARGYAFPHPRVHHPRFLSLRSALPSSRPLFDSHASSSWGVWFCWVLLQAVDYGVHKLWEMNNVGVRFSPPITFLYFLIDWSHTFRCCIYYP
jgi:hypothetical protein